MVVKLTLRDAGRIHKIVESQYNEIQHSVLSIAVGRIGASCLAIVNDYNIQYRDIIDTFRRTYTDEEIVDGARRVKHTRQFNTREQVSLLLSFVRRARLSVASRIDEQKQQTGNQIIVDQLNKELAEYDDILTWPMFEGIDPFPLPKLSDFLKQDVLESLPTTPKLQPRQYDEKFGVLLASRMLATDLSYYRSLCCDDRGVSLALAFIDIDDFKVFNTDLTEPVVDRFVLPRVMSAIEATMYFRGHSYRHGGDEFAVLMPNSDLKRAVAALTELQSAVGSLEFENTDKRVQLSMGLVVIDAACYYTNNEIIGYAARAKKQAKQTGKNGISAYDSTNMTHPEGGDAPICRLMLKSGEVTMQDAPE